MITSSSLALYIYLCLLREIMRLLRHNSISNIIYHLTRIQILLATALILLFNPTITFRALDEVIN